MSEKRNWEVKWNDFEVKKTIESSKSTIDLLEKSIENSNERNRMSLEKIEKWEFELNIQKNEFFEINGITFEEATEYINNSWNPDNDFNLEQYNSIKQIEDKISGEKFYIYQREKLIYKNRSIIEEIYQRIQDLKASK
ncbi:MAG: hypothetical protein K2J02_01315 [Malacoplasma sp.]|nr:hypothetical protein [Malacoplasma sp.]MDE7075100.1 hypothetical protein [Malacoplasma sp.]